MMEILAYLHTALAYETTTSTPLNRLERHEPLPLPLGTSARSSDIAANEQYEMQAITALPF
ncbi:hypothetical protein [Coleofasciculus sp. FACHB-1120]|uniref:hypothetical protein n=1 Tax=Coleofasciculus sp. FACHB-1120 TaxID=2692783 RepID=UPI0016894DAE|nr:hypothetical protein [Coleofasciculus sp. FACHB-1120]MBD2741515.1 hypothetical protein [Coleofasciculus sp. FACHB-1120]